MQDMNQQGVWGRTASRGTFNWNNDLNVQSRPEEDTSLWEKLKNNTNS